MELDKAHSATPTLVGAIEAGGTKFVCAIGDGRSGELIASASIATSDNPVDTLTRATDWLIAQQFGEIQAIGVASFGPIDLRHDSKTYGFITSTPKPGWQNTNFVGFLKDRFPHIPVGFDTDVNGAALGEHRWGCAQGLSDFIYVTIGTGIGGGGMSNGRLMHGLMHPEMGHMRLPRQAGDLEPGVCPFHGDCWEGLCCGPAIVKRFGASAETLPPEHPGWDLTTDYIALAFANMTFVQSPQRIILGGSIRKAGLLGEDQFFKAVCTKFLGILNGYIGASSIVDHVEQYIVPPALGDQAGIRGALALAYGALD